MEHFEHSFFDIPVKQTILDNGLSVFTMDTKTKKTVVQLAFRVGSCRDGKFPGMAHFIEHLNCGTEKGGEPMHPLMRPLVYQGATQNAETGSLRTVYYVNGPAGIVFDSAKVLMRMVFPGDFSAKHVESERQIMLSECHEKNSAEKYRTLSARIFYPHVNIRHNSPLGTVRSFENVTVEHIVDHHRMFYTPDNAAMVAVGSVDHAAFVESVAQEQLPERHCTAEPLPLEKPKLIRAGIEDDILPPSITLVFEGTGDWKTNRVMGRVFDLMLDNTLGTLFQRLRYRDHLVYSVTGSINSSPQEIGVAVPTRPLYFNYAEEMFFEEVGRIARNDISQESFNLFALRKKLYYESELEIADNFYLAGDILSNWMVNDYEDERQFTQSITREQVAEAARKFLRRDAYGCLHIFRK